MLKLSVALATYNEEANIRRCLASVEGLTDEVVVVDGGSTDATVEIARSLGAKVIEADNPPVFHINKQKALDACTGKWILQLDADEEVSGELGDEILAISKKDSYDFMGYYIPRKNFFLGHWMRKGGQYPDYVIRLFLRGKGKFPAKSVHEQIEIDGKVGYLKNPLLHYSYRTLGEYMIKANRYSDLVARQMVKDDVSITIGSHFIYNTVLPLRTFLNLFIRHKGFVDGWYGFLYAVLSGMHHAMAFTKLRHIVGQKSK